MGQAKKESGDQGGCSLLEVGREDSGRNNCQGQGQQGLSNQSVRQHPLGLILYTSLGKRLKQGWLLEWGRPERVSKLREKVAEY